MLADLERAISTWRDVAGDVPHPEHGEDVRVTDPARMNLASGWRSHFDATGRLEDLAQAERLERDVLARTGSAAAAGLGSTLMRRYDAVGGKALLDEAVELHSLAAARTEPRAPAGLTRRTNLANALLSRFDLTGDRADLDTAVVLHHEVCTATPVGARDRPSRWTNLGGALRRRAARFGDPADLDRAIEAYQEALTSAPVGHASWFAFANNLANGLRDRYQRTGSLTDLDRAVDLYTQAASSETAGGYRSVLLAGLGIATGERARRTAAAAAYDAAVAAFEAALDATLPESPARIRQKLNLANALYERAAHGQIRDGDLDRAVNLARHAVSDIEPELPDPATGTGGTSLGGASAVSDTSLAVDSRRAWNRLAVLLSARAEADDSQADRAEAAVAAHRAVAASAPGTADHAEFAANLALFLADLPGGDAADVRARFDEAVIEARNVNLPAGLFTASNWARWQEGREDWPGAVAAYREGLDAMERLQSSQTGRVHRETWLASAQGLAARAAYAAVQDRSPDEAFRLLQRGQAVLLRAALIDPALPATLPREEERPDDVSVPEEFTAEEPLVAAAATSRGGVALVATARMPVVAVPLPRLTTDREAAWADVLAQPAQGRIGPVLAELWQDVMAPTLQACPTHPRALT